MLVRSGHGPDGSWEVAFGRPHPRLRPGLISYRGFRLGFARPRRRLETPIGAATVVFGFGDPVRILRPGRAPDTLVSLFCGPTTTPAVGEHGGRLAGIEVLLTPWAAFTLFGTPQHELAERTVDPDDLPHALDIGVCELAGALAALPTWQSRFGLLDEVFTRWSAAGVPSSARVVRAWSELVRTGGAMPVPRLAEEVGWSARHLENRFREQIGLGPKAAARVLRLQRARRLLAAGRGAAETAALCGFYDQAHLSGEFKTMTGCTPREFTAARRSSVPTADGAPGADRLAGEATSVVLASGGSSVFSNT
ncbi:helix-turn-helix domain-containing protein [Streptomyces sp. YS415]|uniref:helix-turn-helix domain-containing protein n=1 Tax=Streptomyces sp. YS415 TaxID=2944806 RepID=UPI002022575C|nr:helix-turn-helix domain-containing protein [Streptomyces sp. YS415]MCL7429324.1 helix-turn-helix domain-containing protein [Streptomyces sp. YS415]